MHRAGDVAFLGGIVLAYQLYGTVQFSELFERAEADPGVVSLLGTGLTLSGATAVTLLIFVGANEQISSVPPPHVAARFTLCTNANPCAPSCWHYQCRWLSSDALSPTLHAEHAQPFMSFSPLDL
jgi:hypothetical protein